MSKRKKPPPTLDELREAARLLIATSGRGGPLMAASWVDDALETYLRGYFSKDQKLADELFGFDRPLGTFGTRVKVAYLLGLISSEVREDLETIRRIRNELAHLRGKFSFKKVEIRRKCAQLHAARIFSENTPGASRVPRQQFIVTAFLLAAAFLSLAESAEPPASSVDGTLLYIRRLTKSAALRNSLLLYRSVDDGG